MTPFRPSASSYRQPRSRSTPRGAAAAAAALFILARNPPLAGGGVGAAADQFRLTLAMPPTAPDLVSETRGAPLVSDTFPVDAAGADEAAAGATGAGAAGTGLGRLV